MGRDGMGRDGTGMGWGWDEMGWDGDGMRWAGMGWDGRDGSIWDRVGRVRMGWDGCLWDRVGRGFDSPGALGREAWRDDSCCGHKCMLITT